MVKIPDKRYAGLKINPSAINHFAEPCPFKRLHIIAQSETQITTYQYINRGNLEQDSIVNDALRQLHAGTTTRTKRIRMKGIYMLGYEIPAITFFDEVLDEVKEFLTKAGKFLEANSLQQLYNAVNSKAKQMGYESANIVFTSFMDGLAMWEDPSGKKHFVIFEAKSTDVGFGKEEKEVFAQKRQYYTIQPLIYRAAIKHGRIPRVINPFNEEGDYIWFGKNISPDNRPRDITDIVDWDNPNSFDIDTFFVFVNANPQVREKNQVTPKLVSLDEMAQYGADGVYQAFKSMLETLASLLERALRTYDIKGNIEGFYYHMPIIPNGQATLKQAIEDNKFPCFVNQGTAQKMVNYLSGFPSFRKVARDILQESYDNLKNNNVNISNWKEYKCQYCNYAGVSCKIPEIMDKMENQTIFEVG